MAFASAEETFVLQAIVEDPGSKVTDVQMWGDLLCHFHVDSPYTREDVDAMCCRKSFSHLLTDGTELAQDLSDVFVLDFRG